ncbi:uncharacterized protein G2W53_042647 [Senna tora]|uniref:Uncharacterized protein n=1 Tax=Senna tora TaxID=362788 RepID=A0A834SH97_9FABA|nr:uncharacterized protein G2W53_042647 [Senna tora]
MSISSSTIDSIPFSFSSSSSTATEPFTTTAFTSTTANSSLGSNNDRRLGRRSRPLLLRRQVIDAGAGDGVVVPGGGGDANDDAVNEDEEVGRLEAQVAELPHGRHYQFSGGIMVLESLLKTEAIEAEDIVVEDDGGIRYRVGIYL